MKIQSCHLENVRGLRSMQLDFVDPVSQQVRQRTVIAGSNGSGKTTILEAIGQCLSALGPKELLKDWVKLDFAASQFTIAEFPVDGCETFSVGLSSEFSEQGVDTELIDNSEKDRETDSLGEPSELSKQLNILSASFAAKSKSLNLNRDIGERIMRAIDESGDFPNCIYFPSEKRQLQKKEVGEVIAEPTSYEWVYRFDDSQKWRGSLESFLSSLYWRDLQTWYDESKETNGNKSNGHQNDQSQGEFLQFVKTINSFLSGKQIQGIDRKTFRVLVETDSGIDLSFDQLSSGEKQIILFLGELQRRIQHGSIVMIDEPEIHLHPRWQRMLMRGLTDLCEAYDAQLIITTHSEEIANSVYKHELVLLDDIFEPNSAEAEENLQPS